MEAMPHTRDGAFEWEYPAKVIAVPSGGAFLADIDLGLHVHVRALVICEGIDVDWDDLAAKKEAQRLLKDADVTLRTRRTVSYEGGLGVVADVSYGPWFQPRSEQGSFAAAMLASGYAKVAA
jgi:hypothetical protein